MFKSTTDFQVSLINVLNAINAGVENCNQWSPGISDIQLHDVLEYALNHGLIKGIGLRLSGDHLSLSYNFPRLTFEGLRYLESL